MYELKNVTHISCHCYSKYLLIDKTELGNRDSVVSLGGGEQEKAPNNAEDSVFQCCFQILITHVCAC